MTFELSYVIRNEHWVKMPNTSATYNQDVSEEYSNLTRSTFFQDIAAHRYVLNATAHLSEQQLQVSETWPFLYVKVRSEPMTLESSTSRQGTAIAAREYYGILGNKLDELEQLADNENAPVEKGALVSARELLKQAQARRLAPPEITWHGGDAVVMLWAFSSTTFAVTITEGEAGYVIRRDRKQIECSHSIPLSEFKLLTNR